MTNPQQLIIYLDIFAFLSLLAFFIILFKSSSLFIKKNNWTSKGIKNNKLTLLNAIFKVRIYLNN